jgi:hypothetical protein
MTRTRRARVESVVEQLDVSVYGAPTDCPESDGTLEWDRTTIVIDGAPTPIDGALVPDRSRPGMGLELKRSDAERYVL